MAFRNTIQRGILEAKAAKRAGFNAEHQARYDLYHEQYREYLAAKIQAENPNTFAEFSLVYIDLLKMIVDRLAGDLYSDKWKRSFSVKGKAVSDDLAKRLRALYTQYDVESALDKAARYCELHKTVAVYIVWRHEQVEIEVLPPMLWEVRQGEPDPVALADVEAWIVQQTAKVDTPIAEEIRDLVWTQHVDHASARNGIPQYFVVDANGNIIEQEDNPYWYRNEAGGYSWILPVEVLRRSDPDKEFFAPGGEDLVDAALHVAYELSDIARTAKYQSHGQGVFTGADPTETQKMILSPSKAFNLPEGADFNFKSAAGGLLTERLGQLEAYLAKLAHSKNLPADTFNPDKAPESGVARRLANGPLDKVRKGYLRRLAAFEQRLFSKLLIVHNRRCRAADALPEDLTLHVQPYYEGLPLDPVEQANVDQQMLDQRVISAVDILMRDLGLSREDAEARYLENQRLAGEQVRNAQQWEQTQRDEKLIALGVITAVDIIMREQGLDRAAAERQYQQNLKINSQTGAGGLRARLEQQRAAAGTQAGG